MIFFFAYKYSNILKKIWLRAQALILKKRNVMTF